MRIYKEESTTNNQTTTPDNFLDMATIRSRVARIKASWTPETKRARAKEGERRRRELESIVLDLITDTSGSEEYVPVEQASFSLVG